MLPPLDREWTWEAWAATQKAADPWKKPNTMDEIAKIVHRAKIAGIRPYMREPALQVPFWVINRMLQTVPPPGPWRKEMEELVSKFRISEWANTRNLPFPGLHANERERLLQMPSDTKSQLWHVTELADPETVAQLRRQSPSRLPGDQPSSQRSRPDLARRLRARRSAGKLRPEGSRCGRAVRRS